MEEHIDRLKRGVTNIKIHKMNTVTKKRVVKELSDQSERLIAEAEDKIAHADLEVCDYLWQAGECKDKWDE